MHILEAIYIKQMLEIMDGMLEECSNRSERYLERMFLFALMWTLGAVLEISERDKFEEYVVKHPSKLSKLYLTKIVFFFYYISQFYRMAQNTAERDHIRVLC